MIGPLSFGSTMHHEGTYTILYKLDILLRWGCNQYKAWFDTSVIGWAKEVLRQQGMTMEDIRDIEQGL